ncbi:MAG: SH3 domain-containing protein, partial [Clostridiales bacterium]|nr:SH3 domain-containing protein [Clostridiales bacterium]
KRVRITASSLNVRQGPGTTYQAITIVGNNEIYNVLDESGGWYKIEVGSKTGWIAGSYAQGLNESTTFNSVKITASTLNVRQGPDTTYPRITTVKKGEVYIALEESGNWYRIKANGVEGWISANYTEYTNDVPKEMYQFLVLSGGSGVSAEDLNSKLVGKGILEGQGQAFIDAGKKYNINEIYLLSHALLETGHGKSELANGILVDTVDGEEVEPKIVYNMFGIAAYDSSPIRSGSERAYKEGWFTPEEAIIGGGKWIAGNYINHSTYKQDTLYKMRWNPANPGVHQYATDVGWAYKQTSNMDLFFEICDGLESVSLKFDIPIYRGGNHLVEEDFDDEDEEEDEEEEEDDEDKDGEGDKDGHKDDDEGDGKDDEKGPVSRWITEDGKWYYYNAKGNKVTGSHNIGGKTHVFSSGGVWLGEWESDLTGRRFKDPHEKYLKNKWEQIDGKWYYFNGNGYGVTGWQKIGTKWYYMDSIGAMATGWIEVDGKRYYLRDSGAMATGWALVDGKWYYLSGSGAMRTGWIYTGNKWYYLNDRGVMQVGWTKVGSVWYYMDASGAMKTGWIRSDNKWYYMGSSGAMQKGWVQVGAKWYYFKPDGSMAHSTTIDGYELGSDGAWIK